MKKYANNFVSFVGLLCIIIFLVVEFVLLVMEFLGETDVFLGLLIYFIMPILLFIGLGLYFFGMWRYRFRAKSKNELRSHLTFDLTKSAHLKKAVISIIILATIIVASFIGSYKIYHYTESNQFCGLVCHDVMEPEYTVFQDSPHARISCASCHIGEGASWYIKSKLSGARQIYHAFVGDYSKPIQTPVTDLRPAQETCEQCHWPKKFFGAIEQRHDYFITEEEQEEWNVKLLVRVGGGAMGKEGIHAHMFENNTIYYVASDSRRQVIPWVKVVSKAGGEKIFNSEDSPYVDTLPPDELIRKMDCIDCHNRPSHQFKAPYRSVNEALSLNTISKEIPELKLKILELFEKEYVSQDSAVILIKAELMDYYSENHSEFLKENTVIFDSALVEVEKMYRKSIFPYMKARWDSFPDNIGHLISDGCFRCHDNKHESKDEDIITKDCNACHIIIEQGLVDAVESNTRGLKFRHPIDIGDSWEEENCTECHTGGAI